MTVLTFWGDICELSLCLQVVTSCLHELFPVSERRNCAIQTHKLVHQDLHDSFQKNLTVNSGWWCFLIAAHQLTSTASLPPVDNDLCCDTSTLGTYWVLIFCPCLPTLSMLYKHWWLNIVIDRAWGTVKTY